MLRRVVVQLPFTISRTTAKAVDPIVYSLDDDEPKKEAFLNGWVIYGMPGAPAKVMHGLRPFGREQSAAELEQSQEALNAPIDAALLTGKLTDVQLMILGGARKGPRALAKATSYKLQVTSDK